MKFTKIAQPVEVPLTNGNDLLKMLMTQRPEPVFAEARTTDPYCTIVHQVRQDGNFSTPISHKVLGAYTMLGGPANLKGKVFVVAEIGWRTKDGAREYSDRRVYVPAADGTHMELFPARSQAEERCLAVPEGSDFKYRNITRRRLTSQELQSILGGREWRDRFNKSYWVPGL